MPHISLARLAPGGLPGAFLSTLLVCAPGSGGAWYEYRPDTVTASVKPGRPLVTGSPERVFIPAVAGMAPPTVHQAESGGANHRPAVAGMAPLTAYQAESGGANHRPAANGMAPPTVHQAESGPDTLLDCPGNVQVVGPARAHHAQGFGRKVPLRPAMEMLAPEGWQLHLRAVEPDTRLSWQTGQNWLAVLGTLLAAHCVQVNWPRQTVEIRKRTHHLAALSDTASDTPPRVAPKPSPGMIRSTAHGTGGARNIRVWKLDRGDTLRDTLAHWSDLAGWQLVWDVHNDYRIDARSSYVGNYREAVSRLLDDLEHSGLPLGAELYTGNQVLRVKRVR